MDAPLVLSIEINPKEVDDESHCIEYDTKSERVKAQASRAGGNDNSRRVTVIIPPSTSDESAPSNNKTKNKSE